MTTFMPDFTIREAVRKVLPYMMEMREYFHARPELSGNEFDTCRTIFRELSLMGVTDIKIIAGTGVTGIIHGNLPGPTVLLPAKIDALPVNEADDCPYASLFPGIMHASGHDGDTATLLGLAKLLLRHKDCLRGTIRLVFEPESEKYGSVTKLIDNGILAQPRCDYAVNLKLDSTLGKGRIGFGSDACLASRDDFTITFVGKGGHCTQVSATDSVLQKGVIFLNTVNAYMEQVNKERPVALVSFGQFQCGNLSTTIPETAKIKGTVRTYDDDLRQRILARLRDLCDEDCRWQHCFVSPVGRNNEALCAAGEEILRAYGGDQITPVPLVPDFRADDFSRFAEFLPTLSCFAGIAENIPLPSHYSGFLWDSSLLKYACEALALLVYYLPSYVKQEKTI